MAIDPSFAQDAESGKHAEHSVRRNDGGKLGIHGTNVAIDQDLCLAPGTLVHTNPDVKRVEEILEGNRVLGHDGIYHTVTKRFARHYKGELIKIKARGSPAIRVTPNHPILVKERRGTQGGRHKLYSTEPAKWIPAGEVTKSHLVLLPQIAEVRDKEFVAFEYEKKEDGPRMNKVPRQFKLTSEFLRLAGYYLAEGCVVGDFRVTWTFNSKETNYVEDVTSVIKGMFPKLYIKVSTVPEHNATTVIVNSKELVALFSHFGIGAQNKGLPYWAMVLPPEKQKELLIGMWRGDGHCHKRSNAHKFAYVTISRKLAEQMRHLLLRVGICSALHVKAANGIHKEAYYILVSSKRDMTRLNSVVDFLPHVPEGKNTTRFMIYDGFLHSPVREVEREAYEGEVHNLEVAECNSYVAENMVVHNCISDGICLQVCPVNVFDWVDNKNDEFKGRDDIKPDKNSQWKADPKREGDCIFCMACQSVCPVQAILITQK